MIRIQTLFRDEFVGVARIDHSLLQAEITPYHYAACDHVVVSRRGISAGPVDRALADLGLDREIIAVVPNFSAAFALTAKSDLVALLPQSFDAARIRQLGNRGAVKIFALPMKVDGSRSRTRLDVDAGHRWLRGLVLEATADSLRIPD